MKEHSEITVLLKLNNISTVAYINSSSNQESMDVVAGKEPTHNNSTPPRDVELSKQ